MYLIEKLFFLIFLFSFLFLPYLFDSGQCTRSCLSHFTKKGPYRPSNREITGFWTALDRLWNVNRCFCEERTKSGKIVELGDIPRLFPEEELGFPYIWKDPSVCATDGKVYGSKELAKANSVEPLHCGPYCGECSTKWDIQRYKEIGEDVSKVVGPCILAYLLVGQTADRWCMTTFARFTPACTNCWVEDHGCLASHCFYDCVFKGSKHWQRLLGIQPEGEQTANNETCLVCMEKYCSAPFIRSCGVNRRSAGVKTDLARDEREICKLD